MESKNLKLLLTISLVSFMFLIQTVAATTFSTFTLQIADLMKIAITLVGVIIVVLVVKAVFRGPVTFAKVAVYGIFLFLFLIILLALGPVLVNYIATNISN